MGAPGDGAQSRHRAIGEGRVAYVILTITFRCPGCGEANSEQMIAETDHFDSEEVAFTLSRQSYSCRLCSRLLPNGTPANVHAEPATRDQLLHLGFPSSCPK